jgi:thioredoxin-related protein
LYNEYKSKNFEILAVSIDKSRLDWLTAINNEKLSWTNVWDKGGLRSELYQIFGLKGVPDNFLLDKEGKIVARNLRSSELKTVLDKLISDN